MQLWACAVYSFAHKQRVLVHPEATVPVDQGWSRTINSRCCLIFARSLDHTKPAAFTASRQKPRAVTNCYDPAASHNNHQRLQQCFIQQEASDVDIQLLVLDHSCQSRKLQQLVHLWLVAILHNKISERLYSQRLKYDSASFPSFTGSLMLVRVHSMRTRHAARWWWPDGGQ